MKSITTKFALLLLLVPIAAAANGDCKGKSCNDSNSSATANSSATSTVTSTLDAATNASAETGAINYNNESRALALGNSLGDVDIAQCLGSTQWSTPVFGKQKLQLNWPCMAEFYLRNGRYDLAAMAICNTEIAKEFESESDCEAAHNFEPNPSSHTEAVVLQEQVEGLQRQITELEQRPVPAPIITYQSVITDERKAAVYRALEKESE